MPSNALSAKGLAFTRNGAGRAPFELRDFSLALRSGELVILTGPSGGGKSSLLLALAGLIPCNEGTLSLNGRPSGAFPSPLWRTRIRLAQAEPQMVEGTVAENLRLAWQFRAGKSLPVPTDKALLECLSTVGLETLALGEDAGRLSTGQRERVALLRQMLTQPDFLLLDEPVANLDESNAGKVWQTVERFRQEFGAGVLCATHRPPPYKPTRALLLSEGCLSG